MEQNQGERSNEDLICSYLKGELTPEEKTELIKWLNLDKTNKRYFDECCELWITSRSVSGNPGFNAQEGFWKFRQRINSVYHNPGSSRKEKPSLVRTALKYAAVFILAFSFGGVLFFNIDKKSKTVAEQTINELIVPLGSKAVFSLSDGTVITLNAGSRIKVDPSFGNLDRTIELEGEGYFNVAKDENKPFIVKTPYLNVTALGTEFNIKAYTVDKTIETTLVTGSVKIEPTSNDSKGEITILKPNEKLTFFKEDSRIAQGSASEHPSEADEIKPQKVSKGITVPRLIKEDVNIEPVVSWKENKWIFEQKSLSQIAVDLERKYDVKIAFESEILKTYRFTGIILAEPIEQVLEVMSITAPINFRLKGNLVTLSENKDFIDMNKDLYVKP